MRQSVSDGFDFERRQADWLSFEEARKRVLAHALKAPLAVEPRSVTDAAGGALGEDILSTVTLPSHDNSAMDGYAVRGHDIRGATPDRPVALRVVGALRPGRLPHIEVGVGEAVRIMTGGIVPEGADSVVRVEDTDAEAEPGRVLVRDERDCGRNIRPKGEDVTRGELALRRGSTLGVGQLGLLLAMGATSVPLHRTPVVAILSNGDELVRPGEGRPEGSDHSEAPIIDTNGPMLAAAVRAAGATPRLLDIAPDDRDIIRERLLEASDADLLLTSGGASMGEADFFKRVLDEMGFVLDFWRVRMRPGTPVSFGHLPPPPGARKGGSELRPLPIFGLPGNPVSAYVTFQLLARPFLLALAGHENFDRPTIRARVRGRFSANRDHTVFLRVKAFRESDGELAVELTGAQGSGLLSSLGHADGLAVLPAGIAEIEEGGVVQVILLGDGPGWIGDALNS